MKWRKKHPFRPTLTVMIARIFGNPKIRAKMTANIEKNNALLQHLRERHACENEADS